MASEKDARVVLTGDDLFDAWWAAKCEHGGILRELCETCVTDLLRKVATDGDVIRALHADNARLREIIDDHAVKVADLFAKLETAERKAAATAWAWDQARLASIDAANLEAERNDLHAENARLREAGRQVRDDASALAAASDTGDAPDIVRGLRSLYTLADAALAGTEDSK